MFAAVAPATMIAFANGATTIDVVSGITIFALAVFVGFEIITKVPPTLHTPLMSGSNAISGITIVGALLSKSQGEDYFATILGFTALIFAVRRDPVVAVRLAGLCKRVQVGAGPDPGVNASRRPATLVVLRDSERGVVDELLWIPDLPA